MKEAFIKLHLSVLLAGGTGVFGKLITLNEFMLVWYRLLLAAILFYFVLKISGSLKKVGQKDILKIGLVGTLLALHWVFFYASIKFSNVSIGVVCLSLMSFFTAIFEPVINRKRISVKEIAFSLIAVAGIVLIFHFDTRYRTGVLLGIISSALASLFTIMNKKVSVNYSSGTMLLYEMCGGFVGLTVLMPLYSYCFNTDFVIPGVTDFCYLLALASVCTVCLYILQIQVLKVISAFTVNLSYNLEPIYSIILAMMLFDEGHYLDSSFYMGLLLILFSVVLQSIDAFIRNRAL